MQDLKTQYNSPTLGLYFFAPEYLEFVSNLEYYLTDAKIEFSDSSKYGQEFSRKKTCEFTIEPSVSNLVPMEKSRY